MATTLYKEVINSFIDSYSESELAIYEKRNGRKVLNIKGRFWKETFYGFYEPIHWLSCMDIEYIFRPTMRCWGYRSTLSIQDQSYANGFMPVHLLENIDGYTENTLPSKRRNQLRKSRKLAQIVQVIDPQPLYDFGYEILKSSVSRTGHGSITSYTKYCSDSCNQILDPKRITIAGLVDGVIGGYMVLFAVDQVMYIDSVIIATDYLKTDIGTALVFEAVQIARRSEGIRSVVYGLNSREDSRLGVFKEGMGFDVRSWPIKYQIPSLMLHALGLYSPDKLYRLTGMQ